MRKLLSIATAAAITTLVLTSVPAAQTKPATPVAAMATILLSLNHFPSDAEKATLKQISGDAAATANEKTVAQALSNVMHTVNAADKPKLEAIVKDAAAPEGVKTLAAAILAVNHTATDADKGKLKKLLPS